MEIRAARSCDAAAMAHIFYRSVREGAAPAYTEAQRKAWAGQEPTPEVWAQRIDGLKTFVAEQNGAVVGFMSMRMLDGYLDLAFMLPEVRGTGVSAAIYNTLESHARDLGLSHLTSHASHMARPFFERQDWRVVRPMQADMGGVILDNWLMEKSLL